MTAIVEPDAAQLGIAAGDAARLRRAFEHDGGARRAHRRRRPHEFAVVIGPRSPSDDAATFAQWARVHRPDLGVILLRDTGRQRRPVDGPAQRHARGRRGQGPRRHHHGRAAGPASSPARSPRPWRTRRRLRRRRGHGRRPGRRAAAATGGRRRPAGQGAHRLLHQGRRRQEPGRDQHRAWRWPSRAARSASSTSTSTAATSRSCCSSHPTRTINDLVAFNGDDRRRRRRVDPDAALRPTLPSSPHRCSSTPRTRPPARTSASCSTRSRRMFDFVVVDTSGVVRRPRADRARPHRHHRPGRHARHPGAQGPQARDRHPRPAQLPARHVEVRAQPGRRQGRPDRRRVRVDPRPQGRLLARLEPRGARGRQPRRALVRAYPSHPNSKAIKAFASPSLVAARTPRSAPRRPPRPHVRRPLPTEEGLT